MGFAMELLVQRIKKYIVFAISWNLQMINRNDISLINLKVFPRELD